MRFAGAVLAATLLGGCAQLPAPGPHDTVCARHEASYECQVERYGNVNA